MTFTYNCKFMTADGTIMKTDSEALDIEIKIGKKIIKFSPSIT